jgi:hypothetical protein
MQWRCIASSIDRTAISGMVLPSPPSGGQADDSPGPARTTPGPRGAGLRGGDAGPEPRRHLGFGRPIVGAGANIPETSRVTCAGVRRNFPRRRGPPSPENSGDPTGRPWVCSGARAGRPRLGLRHAKATHPRGTDSPRPTRPGLPRRSGLGPRAVRIFMLEEEQTLIDPVCDVRARPMPVAGHARGGEKSRKSARIETTGTVPASRIVP